MGNLPLAWEYWESTESSVLQLHNIRRRTFRLNFDPAFRQFGGVTAREREREDVTSETIFVKIPILLSCHRPTISVPFNITNRLLEQHKSGDSPWANPPITFAGHKRFEFTGYFLQRFHHIWAVTKRF